MKVFKFLGRMIWVIIAIIAVAVVTCVLLVSIFGTNIKTIKGEENTEQVAPPEPEITGAEMRVLFAGTTFWGRRTNTDARASELGVKYPFSQLDTLDRKNYDAWIGGLECPVTDNGHNKAEEENIFKFNCDPDYLPEAAKYFTAFLLGNNHAGNQGKAGLETTRNYLKQNGIQYFGTPKRTANDTRDPEYANDDPAINNCGIVVLPVRISLDNGTTDKYQIPFGFCSAHGVYGVPGEDYLQNMKTFAQYVPTIAMPHMGAEYKTSHDTIRQNLYRKMIDYGVESVIADHPHWLQDSEAYKDKLIVYSMGNFMFDQTFNNEVVRSAAIEANAVINITNAQLEDWNALGEKCLESNGGCFDDIVGAGLPKLSITWTYDYHGTTSAGNRITRLAPENEQVAIGQRLNWGAIPASLKISK
ncbi:MAG: CapA family protein [Candidatus Saccharibacteria bacterium]|nr:CapA family protein [Candidatus Saccharibacteria bacterium]